MRLFKERNPDFDLDDLKIQETIDDLKKQYDLVEALYENINILEKLGYNLETIDRQVVCKGAGGRIDILTKEKETRDLVLIQLKNSGASKATFNQISEYMGWALDRLSTGEKVKGLVISNGHDDEFKSAIDGDSNIEYINLSDVLGELVLN
jgi:hypothetical protein